MEIILNIEIVVMLILAVDTTLIVANGYYYDKL